MYLAVDVGASKTLLALFDEQGQIIKQTKLQTAPQYQAFLETLDEGLPALIENQIVKLAGSARPGAASETREKVSTNLQWGETSIRSHLERLLKIPVRIDNDCNLAGLAEAVMGAGQEYSIVLYVTLSTGVGTGVIINKKIALPKSE